MMKLLSPAKLSDWTIGDLSTCQTQELEGLCKALGRHRSPERPIPVQIT
ncbi:hypothetical protein [Peribacillus sp. FSL E2-0218]